MPAIRHIQRAVLTLALIASAGLSAFAGASGDEQSVQKLVERGALQEAVDLAASEGGNPESTYLAAQALIKMDHSDAAEEQYNRLRDEGDDSWKAIGESGAKLLAGDVGGAMDAANRAIAADEGNPYAPYHQGLVAAKQGNFKKALEGFSRAIELKPDFAYAHYYAGQAAQRLRQTPKMAEHFNAFVRLAPEAPERQAVQAILRSLR